MCLFQRDSYGASWAYVLQGYRNNTYPQVRCSDFKDNTYYIVW